MRHPHYLRPHEIARILAEHAACVLLLLAAQVVGGVLRDERLPALAELAAWLDADTWRLIGTAASRQVHLVELDLLTHLKWNSLAAAVLQYSMYLHGLYSRQPVRTARRRFLLILRSAAVAAVVVALVFFFARPRVIGRATLALGFTLAVVALWAARTAWAALVQARPERVLVLGGGAPLEQVRALAADGRLEGFDVIGRVGDPTEGADPGFLGSWDALPAILDRERVDRLLVASSLPAGWDVAPVVEARLAGIQVVNARDFAEGLTGEVLESDIGADFITAGTAKAYNRVGRLLDVALGTLLLVVLLPVMLLVALVVLASSGWPVLFGQRRVGQAGRAYTCWKFRTMATDAERDGPAWSPEDDPRVTRVGRFLRRWRLDELPQLWNVVAGDMAFVGPRPEQPFFVTKLARTLPHYSLRHVVRPGLTGWAQVRFPYGSSEEDARGKLRYDLFYVKHRSPYLDLAILFDTLRVVLTGRGR